MSILSKVENLHHYVGRRVTYVGAGGHIIINDVLTDVRPTEKLFTEDGKNVSEVYDLSFSSFDESIATLPGNTEVWVLDPQYTEDPSISIFVKEQGYIEFGTTFADRLPR